MANLTDQLVGIDFNAARLDAIHAETISANDYMRRIHWWVRLFGVVWIVIPALIGVLAVVFMIGVAAKGNGY